MVCGRGGASRRAARAAGRDQPGDLPRRAGRTTVDVNYERVLGPVSASEDDRRVLASGVGAGGLPYPEGFDDLVGQQDFYEFRITRKDLFAGTAGGLHAVGPRDEEIIQFLSPPPDDPFEEAPPVRPGTSRTMARCSGCHSRPGIHSVEAYRRGFIHLPRPAHLREYDRGQQERAAMLRKWENHSWGLLQGLMERE
jgi:hypothetical protein